MAGKIFINYRRGDDAGFTQALYQRLEDEFTAGDLFMDVEGYIKPGDDFVEVLNTQVAAADVLLVVIGPRWAELLAARASDSDDFVAIEIVAGLEKGKRVIPVLVGGASMPRADTLPETMRPLARRNAVGLRPERFKADCQGLVTALKEHLTSAEKERAARTDAERAAAEADRLKREAEEAARIAAAEERARAQTVAGLSPEEIRKAEELANWDFIKDKSQPQALRDHLARFPNGVTALYALTKLEELVWAGIGSTPDLTTLQAFLDEFPKGGHADAARGRVADLTRQAEAAREAERRRAQETEAWGAVAAGMDKTAIEAFLRDWPQGQHAAAARARIAELKRGPGSRRRWMLQGAGVTAGLVAVVAAGWWQQAWLQEQYIRLTAMGMSVLSAEQEKGKAADPGSEFKECVKGCPTMIVISSGKFVMGSPDNEKGRSKDEGPQHEVTIIKPFAVSKFAVTFAEWDVCAGAGACIKTSDNGWGRDDRPVIKVNWEDAKQYAAWLSRMSGKPYRLLSEAEWEYAARAGSKTAYSWGDTIGAGNANCDGCKSKWDNKQTAPVGSFKPNAYGLYDMQGNVRQWVEDCAGDYSDAPTDGSARTTGDCSSRLLRGGSWYDTPLFLRAAFRGIYVPTIRNNFVGFRVARTLNP